MSTSDRTSEIVLKRVVDPSEEEIETILQVMIKGFENEAFANRFALPPGTDAVAAARAQQMGYLGAALVQGEIWTAVRKSDDKVVGVGIWAVPGNTLGDLPEQKRYKDELAKYVSAEQWHWINTAKKKITDERETCFPGLWRDTFHLHLLVTHPDARGTGAGQAIVNEMVRQARAEGKGSSLATTTEPNRRFYEKRGFTTVFEREMVYPDGAAEPYIAMALDLGS